MSRASHPVANGGRYGWGTRVEFNGERDDGSAAGLQCALKQRMTRLAQNERVAWGAIRVQQLYRDAIVVFGEARLGELQLQFGEGVHGSQQRVRVLAQARGHVEQDAMHLRLLVIQQTHQLIVLLDGLERLDEDGLAAGGGAVSNALHAAALLDFHRDDEALAANRD